MSDLMNLLFDYYTQHSPAGDPPSAPEREAAQEKFRQLKTLVGEMAAIEIWDAASAASAEDEAACFQAGVRAGVELTTALLRL